MSRTLTDLEPHAAAKAGEWLRLCAADGVAVLISHTLRSFEEQGALFAQGRTQPGKIVTNADAGHSFHNYGMAWDAVPWKAWYQVGKPDLLRRDLDWTPWISPMAESYFLSTPAGRGLEGLNKGWREMVKYADTLGIAWGGRTIRIGNSRDWGHFDYTRGQTIAQLLAARQRSTA